VLGEDVESRKARAVAVLVAVVILVASPSGVEFPSEGDRRGLGLLEGAWSAPPAVAPATMYLDGMNPIADLGGWSKNSGSG
jgi:hypothetical protein